MEINRRRLLLKGAAAGAFASLTRGAKAQFQQSSQSGVPHGWNTLGLGDGGYVLGVDVCAAGAASGAVCKTDVSGAYFWNGSKWLQVYTASTLTDAYGRSLGTAIGSGVWEIRLAPSDPSHIYMVTGTPDNAKGSYAVFACTNSGTSWPRPSLTFKVSSVIWGWDEDLPNSGPWRLTSEKIVIDPHSPNVAYVGIPHGTSMTGKYAGNRSGIYRTIDSGATWQLIPDIPAPVISPGYCGMVIDANSKTTSLNGNTVSSRILIPCSGIGVYQSLDGGATFSKITADATTPPTRFTYTTTHDDSIIILQIYCYQQGSVRNVTSTGPSPLTWQHRAGPLTPNSYNFGNLFEYWAHAPSGTYEISVNYNDGNNAAILGHQVGNYSSVVDGPPAATFTAAISNTGTTGVGAVVNVTRVLTGTLTLGQVIQGGRSLSGNHAYHIAKQVDGVPGGTGRYELNAYVDLDLGPIDYKAFNPVTNQVNAFAVTGANTKAPFDTGGPAFSWPGQYIGAAPTIVTKGGRSMVFGIVFNPAVYSPDAGYTLMASDANYAFMAQISSSPVAPGPQTGLTFGGACGFALIDALVQAPGATIALDGTPVYVKSGPYRDAQPTNVTTAQMSYDGTYWCVSGPESGAGQFTGASGGIWRYWKNGAAWQWERIDGSLSGMRGGVGFPTPVYISAGNAICVDPRKGREGNVVFTGPNKGWNGSQTANGNAPLDSIIWRTNRSNRGIVQTLTSPVGWLNFGGPYAGADGQQVGNMVLDPATGHYWQAGGKGVFEITTFNVGGPVVAIVQAQGIEEMLVQDFCTPPGSPTGTPLVGVEDEMVLNVDIPGYASAKPIAGDSNCWQIDYAGDDPSHVCCYAKGSINFGLSGYSTDYGKTWKPYASSPEGNLLGGCIAYVHSSGKIVCINQSGGGTAVRYSVDTGASWHLSNGSPVTHYIGIPQIPYRLLAAERDGSNTVYLFAPNGDGTHRAGVYKSTDGGANFSPTTGQPTGFAPGNGWTLYTTPGFPGHLWLSQIQYWDSGNYIAHSPDGGATWVNINPGLTRVLNFTMGKQAPNGIYPRLFKRVFERGTFIWFYSDDKGATWVNFGTGAATIPSGSYLAHPTFCMGDWNNVGRLYVGWGKAGAIYYNP